MRRLFLFLLTCALLLPAVGSKCAELPPARSGHHAAAMHAKPGHAPVRSHDVMAQHDCIGCIAPIGRLAPLADIVPPARSSYAAFAQALLLHQPGGPRAPPPRA